MQGGVCHFLSVEIKSRVINEQHLPVAYQHKQLHVKRHRQKSWTFKTQKPEDRNLHRKIIKSPNKERNFAIFPTIETVIMCSQKLDADAMQCTQPASHHVLEIEKLKN